MSAGESPAAYRPIYDAPQRRSAPAPLLPLAIALTLGILAARQIGAEAVGAAAWAVAGGAAAGGSFWLWRFGGPRIAAARVLLLLAVFTAGAARYQQVTALPANHVARLVGADRMLTRISGAIITSPQSHPVERHNPYTPFPSTARTRFVLRADELRTSGPPTAIVGDLRVTVGGENFAGRIGDRVEITGWLSRSRGAQNPGEADWASVFALQGIHAALTTDSDALCRVEHRGASRWGSFRHALRSRAAAVLLDPVVHVDADEALRAVDAMVLGQRSAVSARVDQAFIRTGTVHILSVSGSHVAMIGGAVWVVVRYLLRRGRKTAAVTMAVAVLLYAALAEPSAPISRATLMALFASMALLAGRTLASLNWLAASAIVVLAIEPRELLRAGFQLSFVQVLVLFTVVPTVYRVLAGNRILAVAGLAPTDADTLGALVLRRARQSLAALAAVSVMAWVFALPLAAWHFGFITPLGSVQSFLLSPLFAFVIVLGFAGLVLGGLIPVVAPIASGVVVTLMVWLLEAVEALAAWPGALVEIPRPPGWLVLGSYAVLGGLSWMGLRRERLADAAVRHARERHEQPRMPRVRRSGALLAGGLTLLLGGGWAWWIAGWGARPSWHALTVLAVGSGSAAVLTAPDGSAAVFDCGTLHNFDAGEVTRRALRHLRAKSPVALTVSHDNFDHYSGAATLIASQLARQVLAPAGFLAAREYSASVAQLIEDCGGLERFQLLAADDELMVGAARCDVLWPPADLPPGFSANDQSLVFRVTIGSRSLLVTGDIEAAAMQALLDADDRGNIALASDVLVAPHHGSIERVTGEFLRTVNPRVILVSTGRSRDRFRDLVRETLGEGVRVLSTREMGAIEVRVHADEQVEVRTPFARGVDEAAARIGPH